MAAWRCWPVATDQMEAKVAIIKGATGVRALRLRVSATIRVAASAAVIA